jgi:histidinol-phosphate/aromatic aminotransferase/cobyric acid decarboxylase-like protein
MNATNQIFGQIRPIGVLLIPPIGRRLDPTAVAMHKLYKPTSSIVRNFHTTKLLRVNPQIQQFANLVKKDLPSKPDLSAILKSVWACNEITRVCPDLIIRLTTLRGEVARQLWLDFGGNPKQINILAVGTTAVPHHLKGYQKFLSNFYTKTANVLISSFSPENQEIGYDLMSKGAENARSATLNYFNEHYGFGSQELELLNQNSAITCGGMRGLKDLADGCIMYAKSMGIPHRFIQQDNSFGTWFNIIENPVLNDSQRREIHTIQTKPENKLHLSKEDVENFYKVNKPTNCESWYITIVGNPSGTKMTPQQLKVVCETIHKLNPNALVILDVVYVRTLPRDLAKQLLSGVVNNKNVLNQVIFLDSFSKSHGLCRERLGIYFSSNPALFARYHASNITFSAGPGAIKDIQFSVLGTMNQEDKRSIDELHEFWRDERKGLYHYLEKFTDLFEEKQLHVTEDDLNETLGLYILLKTKPGVKAQEVFIKTGILGVDTGLKSGHYIRFSLGCVTEPTFSK